MPLFRHSQPAADTARKTPAEMVEDIDWFHCPQMSGGDPEHRVLFRSLATQPLDGVIGVIVADPADVNEEQAGEVALMRADHAVEVYSSPREGA